MAPRSAAFRSLSHIFIIGIVLLLTFAVDSHAQQTSIVIRVVASAPAKAFIEAESPPVRDWSFRNEYAGVSELGNRIGGFKAFDANGLEVAIRELAPGQFKAANHATKFQYEVGLAPPSVAADAARVSWVNGSRGLLMLADLLPSQETESRTIQDHLKVQVILPNSWMAYANEVESPATTFISINPATTILVIGDRLRASGTSLSGLRLTLLTDGDWSFTDAEILKTAADVLRTHREVFGAMPTPRATLTLFSFPSTITTEKWSAETRGNSVTILLGKQASKAAALAQLSPALSHELFHLWVPNGLAFKGDYDWFYEGFTVYQSARAGVRLGFLTFQDFLNALAVAYDSYMASPDRDRWSLIESSQRRWTTGRSSVYQKSMIIAFLYDLKLKTESRGKRSLDDTYQELFRKYSLQATLRAGMRSEHDGNDAVVAALSRDPAMQEFVKNFILRGASVNLAEPLSKAGLTVEKFAARTRISVAASLTRQQRDLLRDLGYNDSVRSPRRKIITGSASNQVEIFSTHHL